MNRRLIRPTLSDVQDQLGARMQRKKPAPPEQTNAENFYYLKQMQARTPMIVVLDQGETIRGVIEWYDKNCIKVHRTNEPNLLVMKSCIRFMYKDGESRNGNKSRGGHPTASGSRLMAQATKSRLVCANSAFRNDRQAYGEFTDEQCRRSCQVQS